MKTLDNCIANRVKKGDCEIYFQSFCDCQIEWMFNPITGKLVSNVIKGSNCRQQNTLHSKGVPIMYSELIGDGYSEKFVWEDIQENDIPDNFVTDMKMPDINFVRQKEGTYHEARLIESLVMWLRDSKYLVKVEGSELLICKFDYDAKNNMNDAAKWGQIFLDDFQIEHWKYGQIRYLRFNAVDSNVVVLKDDSGNICIIEKSGCVSSGPTDKREIAEKTLAIMNKVVKSPPQWHDEILTDFAGRYYIYRDVTTNPEPTSFTTIKAAYDYLTSPKK